MSSIMSSNNIITNANNNSNETTSKTGVAKASNRPEPATDAQIEAHAKAFPNSILGRRNCGQIAGLDIRIVPSVDTLNGTSCVPVFFKLEDKDRVLTKEEAAVKARNDERRAKYIERQKAHYEAQQAAALERQRNPVTPTKYVFEPRISKKARKAQTAKENDQSQEANKENMKPKQEQKNDYAAFILSVERTAARSRAKERSDQIRNEDISRLKAFEASLKEEGERIRAAMQEDIRMGRKRKHELFEPSSEIETPDSAAKKMKTESDPEPVTEPTPNPTFHPFTRLPRELRQMILSNALDAGCIIEEEKKNKATLMFNPANIPLAKTLSLLSKQTYDDMQGRQGVYKHWTPFRFFSAVPVQAFSLWASMHVSNTLTKRDFEKCSIKCPEERQPGDHLFVRLPGRWLYLEWPGENKDRLNTIMSKMVQIEHNGTGGYSLKISEVL